MSWDSYIDTIMANSNGSCDKACIIGLDGNPWTTSTEPKHLTLKSDEAKKLAQHCKQGDYSDFQAKGVFINGDKYTFLRAGDGLVLAKKKDIGGITMQCSKTALVIAHTKEGGQPGDTNKGVAYVVDYLQTLNM